MIYFFHFIGEPENNEPGTPDESDANSSDDTEDEDQPKKAKSSKSERSNSGLYSSHKFLFGVIFSRCKDSSALVRAKALSTLAEVTSRMDSNPVIADVLKNLVGPSNDENEKRTVDFFELLQNPCTDLSKVNPLPKSEEFIDFLRKRALDDSVFVRKNALQVLENILKYYSENQNLESEIALELVSILSEHCRDPSVMVRKQIIVSLTEILKALAMGY